jgi:hypothetical protein
MRSRQAGQRIFVERAGSIRHLHSPLWGRSSPPTVISDGYEARRADRGSPSRGDIGETPRRMLTGPPRSQSQADIFQHHRRAAGMKAGHVWSNRGAAARDMAR